MKKIIILVLSATIVFMFLGCGQKDEEVTVSTTEKVNLDNSEHITSFDAETTTKATDIEISVSDEQHTTEEITSNRNKNETTTEGKTINDVVVTTENSLITQNSDEIFFSVIFKGYGGKVLKTEKVKKGEDATAPEPPEIKGFLFVKWDSYYKEVNTDIIVNAVYKKITEPTLIIDTVKTNDKEVVVKVSAINNPGLLALLLKINYDESALSLKKVENGSMMKEYTFTGPKNLKSGCNIAWNIIEVPENVVDGEVVLLHFEVNKGAQKGSHDISVTCFDGAFNSDYETVDFDIINGSIIII